MSSSWAGHEWMILRRTPQLNVSSHSWICLAEHNFYRQMGHEWPAMNLSWVLYEWFMSGSWAANSDQPIAWLFERLIGWLANPTWTCMRSSPSMSCSWEVHERFMSGSWVGEEWLMQHNLLSWIFFTSFNYQHICRWESCCSVEVYSKSDREESCCSVEDLLYSAPVCSTPDFSKQVQWYLREQPRDGHCTKRQTLPRTAFWSFRSVFDRCLLPTSTHWWWKNIFFFEKTPFEVNIQLWSHFELNLAKFLGIQNPPKSFQNRFQERHYKTDQF